MNNWSATGYSVAVVEADLSVRAASLRGSVDGAVRRARDLLRQASTTCSKAAQLSAASRQRRLERQAWSIHLSGLSGVDDRRVAICAYCHRIRSGSRWIVLPAGIEGELKDWLSIVLSHTYCPECVAEHERELFTPPPAV